jgi:hypothetical protein
MPATNDRNGSKAADTWKSERTAEFLVSPPKADCLLTASMRQEPTTGSRNSYCIWQYYLSYIQIEERKIAVGSEAQANAVKTHRKRLRQRGIARFEVQAKLADKELIRKLAKQLASDGAAASKLREAVSEAIAGKTEQKGGILAALRRSPLVGADVNFPRERAEMRNVDF